jgi:thiamine-phosphate diphosphorylase
MEKKLLWQLRKSKIVSKKGVSYTMRENVFNKKVFIKSVKNHLKANYRKTIEQAKIAEASGADYMGVGAVFPSPTKTNAVRITNEQLREIISSVSIPAVAIGGISYDNVCELKGSYVSGIAVVSAIFGAVNIEKSTALLKERVKAVVK